MKKIVALDVVIGRKRLYFETEEDEKIVVEAEKEVIESQLLQLLDYINGEKEERARKILNESQVRNQFKLRRVKSP